MSTNQREYFNNDYEAFKSEREENAALLGSFGIVLGVLIVVSGVTLYLLYN